MTDTIPRAAVVAVIDRLSPTPATLEVLAAINAIPAVTVTDAPHGALFARGDTVCKGPVVNGTAQSSAFMRAASRHTVTQLKAGMRRAASKYTHNPRLNLGNLLKPLSPPPHR